MTALTRIATRIPFLHVVLYSFQNATQPKWTLGESSSLLHCTLSTDDGGCLMEGKCLRISVCACIYVWLFVCVTV